MRWTGRLARCQARPHVLSISSRDLHLIRMQISVRGTLVRARTVSTSPFENPTEEGTIKGRETASGDMDALELLQNDLFGQETRRPCEDVKQSVNTPRQDSLERIKTNKPPVMPLIISKTQPSLGNLENANFDIEPGSPLHVMAETNSPGLIWQAYREAVRQRIPISSAFLDRVCRVLVRKYAPTRKTFLRLHEALHFSRQQGGNVKRWQWNSLIHHSALGLRKVYTKDYQAALDIFHEMQSLSAMPGNELHCKPDVYTYTTLLSIAIRTGVTENVDHAYSLLRDSNLQQDRVARLAIIPYYSRNRNLRAIRTIADGFARDNEDMGIDGINAYIWAFGRHGHLNAVEEVYQALRSNLSPEDIVGDSEEVSSTSIDGFSKTAKPTSSIQKEKLRPSMGDPYWEEWASSMNDLDNLISELTTWHPGTESPNGITSHLDSESHDKSVTRLGEPSRSVRRSPRRVNEDLLIMAHHIPDNITYTICIQVHAYRNDLERALQVFRDMITTFDRERPWETPAVTYKAFHKAYRALFLGLVRYSSQLDTSDHFGFHESCGEDEKRRTQETLEFVFQSFLAMEPAELSPNDRTVRWIMNAFANCSGHDPEKLIQVWRALEQRFGPLRVPRLYRNLVSRARREGLDNQ